MSNASSADLIQKFKAYVSPITHYEKPSNAGKKGPESTGKNKRRNKLPEPVLFEERCDVTDPKTDITSVENNEAISDPSSDDLGLYDPDRFLGKGYQLFIRNDIKNVPRNVKRCGSCERKFNETDLLVIKTQGVRKFHRVKTVLVKVIYTFTS